MPWAAGPPVAGVKYPLLLKEWKYTAPVASGSANLMEGNWLRLE